MIDPTKLDINQLPKKFIDGAIGSYGKEGFSFVLTSGNELHSFVTTPTTMKSIADWMIKQVEGYEKQFGPIDMTPPEIVSPLQASDLNK
jgi:hypothetical protein